MWVNVFWHQAPFHCPPTILVWVTKTFGMNARPTARFLNPLVWAAHAPTEDPSISVLDSEPMDPSSGGHCYSFHSGSPLWSPFGTIGVEDIVEGMVYFLLMTRMLTCFRTIRLPDGYTFSDSGPLATLVSIPWFIIGLAGIAWSYVENLPFMPRTPYSSRRGYRHVAVDEDAQVLRFEDED